MESSVVFAWSVSERVVVENNTISDDKDAKHQGLRTIKPIGMNPLMDNLGALNGDGEPGLAGGGVAKGGIIPLGRGSTGRTEPTSLSEKLSMEQAMSNPSAGRQIPLPMTDSRWPKSDGWVKMAQNVNGIEIHYVQNTKTGQVDDFKFK